ncbi:MAG: hypothetical protein M3082_14980, partial [Candidatus Dormibacteraeota bacterium]|nr:hypothetical protein [Candidatus Dormibacteraeota bacterium]
SVGGVATSSSWYEYQLVGSGPAREAMVNEQGWEPMPNTMGNQPSPSTTGGHDYDSGNNMQYAEVRCG